MEVDGLGDLRLKSCGPIETELSVINIEEGGAATTVQHTINKYKNMPLDMKRPLDLNDRGVEDWFERLKNGEEDHKNGTFFLVVAEQDVAKIPLRDMICIKHKKAEGDADSDEDEQLEEFTLKYLGSSPMVVL